MSSELDMSQYVDLFLQEAEEQIEVLETETLALEQDPTDDRMQVIFRAAHTLKGSSRAMGFSNFAELTHEMENVLDQLRNHTLQVTTGIADCLLACIDTLAQMIDHIREGNGDVVECGVLVGQLQEVLKGAGAPSDSLAPSPANAPEGSTPDLTVESGPSTKISADLFDALDQAAEAGPVFHARFTLDDECVMKFVRAFMAISIVEEGGEILASHPSMEDLEDEKFDQDFEMVFQSSVEPDELGKKLNEISEMKAVDLGEWARPAEATEAIVEQVSSGAGEEQAETEAAPIAPTPAGAPAAVAPPSAKPKKSDSNQTVRVDVSRLDNLMNLVGELVIDRTRIAQIGNDLSQKYQDHTIEALGETVGHIARITGDLQDQIMKARMMPIDTVFNRFPRVIRDLAQKLDKDVKLDMFGGDTELDRSVIEVIGDPLLHILRNSVDHGLETPDEREAAGKPRQGVVRVGAKHQENHIVIEIIDDGKGIDVERIKQKAVGNGLVTAEAAARLTDKEALQFIFSSGLSTAAEVSEVSGRGVGMDIVRSNIQKLGGIIDLETTLGEGTKFSLRLPLTLAIIRGLLVSVEERVFVLPLGSVVETLLIKKEEMQRVNQKEVVVIRGVTTPLLRMRKLFGQLETEQKDSDEMYVVIVGLAEHRLGLVVDKLIGEHEVVIKSLSRFCGDIAGVSGATILGDGNVALIVDVNGVVEIDRGMK